MLVQAHETQFTEKVHDHSLSGDANAELFGVCLPFVCMFSVNVWQDAYGSWKKNKNKFHFSFMCVMLY